MPVYDIRPESPVIYDGSHSLIFSKTLDIVTNYKPLSGDIFPMAQVRNTWNDFYSYPTSKPVVTPPPLKENYIDVPGHNGSLDFSESLTGYPTFNNRTGSIAFNIDNYKPVNPEALYSRIKSYLHGQTAYMFLSDNSTKYKAIESEYGEPPELHDYSGSWEPWYYEGRFTVSELTHNQDCDSYSINYNVKPYKFYFQDTTQDWIWDTFNFENGITYKEVFTDVEVDNLLIMQIDNIVGNAPTIPEITINATSDVDGVLGMYVSFSCDKTKKNFRKFLKNGTHKDPDFLFIGSSVEGESYGDSVYVSGSGVKFDFSGTGTVSLKFKIGVM